MILLLLLLCVLLRYQREPTCWACCACLEPGLDAVLVENVFALQLCACVLSLKLVFAYTALGFCICTMEKGSKEKELSIR